MTVYATVGYPGSGKGEAAAVARELAVPVVRMGDVVRAVTRSWGLPRREDLLGQVASQLREREGADAIAARSLPLVRAVHDAYGRVLIDGIRGAVEIERFRTALGEDFSLIAIQAPFEVRLERVNARNRDGTAPDAADLRRRDERERGYGMDDAIEAADIIVDNTDTLDAYREELAAVFDAGEAP